MEPFSHTLPSGLTMTGLKSIRSSPKENAETTPGMPTQPLIIGIHGGTYKSTYFDAHPSISYGTLAEQVGASFIAIDRPGYGGTTSPAPTKDGAETRFWRDSAKMLEDDIIPFLWNQYGGSVSNTSSIVLLGHSMGSAVALLIAGLHGMKKTDVSWPFSGLILHGAGAKTRPYAQETVAMFKTLDPATNRVNAAMKDGVMLGFDQKVSDPSITKFTQAVNEPFPNGDLEERELNEPVYRAGYAKHIDVPVLHSTPEIDCFCTTAPEDLQEFRSWFESCPSMQQIVLRAAPHCVELSLQSRAWGLRCFGFAYECATIAARDAAMR